MEASYFPNMNSFHRMSVYDKEPPTEIYHPILEMLNENVKKRYWPYILVYHIQDESFTMMTKCLGFPRIHNQVLYDGLHHSQQLQV